MKKNRRKKHAVLLEPQQYQHRVECVLHALSASVGASRSLSDYLEEQLGPQWNELDYLLDNADRDLREARRWIRGAREASRSRARTQRGRR